MTRLAPARAAGKTTEVPIWSRAQRRAFTKLVSQQGELRMRATRTAIRHTKRRVQLGQRDVAKPHPTFDWGSVVRASHRKGWPEVA